MIKRDANAPINFCHISPTKYLKEFTSSNGAHLILAHLVEEDPTYADYYANLDDGKLKIMDNSAFEMFKQDRPMYPSHNLVNMAKKCKADVIVLTDYPKEPWYRTIEQATNMISDIKEAGFGTFFVPQSELGDVDGLLKSIDWAIGRNDIDLIGISILSTPIAFGVNEQAHRQRERSDAYKMQRFISRWKVFVEMRRAGILKDANAMKKFHCLGMTDGPNEIQLLTESGFSKYIYSWDSSAAVWAGINYIRFDNSPTGLENGKFEAEVNFNMSAELSEKAVLCVNDNINYINKLCQQLSL
jgi:hypothetical protein